MQIAAATVDIEGCFKKLWDIHRTWIVNVLEDAVIYAKSHRARPKESLQRAIYLTAVRSGNGEEKEVKAVFAQNVWPALKSRGWTIETVESENGSSTRYVKGDQSVSTFMIRRKIPLLSQYLTLFSCYTYSSGLYILFSVRYQLSTRNLLLWWNRSNHRWPVLFMPLKWSWTTISIQN